MCNLNVVFYVVDYARFNGFHDKFGGIAHLHFQEYIFTVGIYGMFTDSAVIQFSLPISD
jgi:hypothetical protein